MSDTKDIEMHERLVRVETKQDTILELLKVVSKTNIRSIKNEESVKGIKKVMWYCFTSLFSTVFITSGAFLIKDFLKSKGSL